MSGRVLNADLAELTNKVSEQCTDIYDHNMAIGKYFDERIRKRIELPVSQIKVWMAEYIAKEEGKDEEDEEDDEDDDGETISRLVEVIEKLQDDSDENAKVQQNLEKTIERMRQELKRFSEQKKTRDQEAVVFQRQVRRQLDDLRRLVALNAGPGQSAPGFPQFSRFPPEVRQMVWRAAVPSRLYCADRSCEDVSFALSVPAIAHVCRESRRVAQALGRLWRMGMGRNPGWSWYTPDRDVFLVRHPQRRITPSGAIEEIAIEPPEGWLSSGDVPIDAFVEDLSFYRWGIPHVLPNLHTVDLLMRKPTLVDKSWNPALVSKLFGGDSVVVVDLSDAAAVMRMQGLLLGDDCPGERIPDEDDSTFQQLDEKYEFFGTLAIRDLNCASDLVEEWKVFARARQQVLEKYIWNKASWTPLTREYAQLWDWDMTPNMEIPWVRDTVNSLRIRPVHIFALLDGRPYTGAQGPNWGS